MATAKPKLLLHACCGPCSTVALERLQQDYTPILYFFNPCIRPTAEYHKRRSSLEKVCWENKLEMWTPEYQPEEFHGIALGREQEPEGGSRCDRCILQRMGQTARAAKEEKIDHFSTTLTTGPAKPARKIFPLGERLAAENKLKFVAHDFKKQGGFLRSLELSKKLNLYRQDYCGCGL